MTSIPYSRTPACFPWGSLLILTAVIFACAAYANLALAITTPSNYRFFPPFQPNRNANTNGSMGGEFFNIAVSVYKGKGFADPFARPTGPTAWQPPLYPLFMAGLLWVFDGDRDLLMTVTIFSQVLTLIGTGLLAVVLARQTLLGPTATTISNLVLVVYLGVVLWNFNLCFQITRDSWLILLLLDVLIAGLCWWRPLSCKKAAAMWGLFGGCCAMINPIVAFTWGMLTLGSGLRARAWSRLALAFVCTGLSLTPWTIRNYLAFGRLIPTKSNLALELYQSQILQAEGVILGWFNHPYSGSNPEGAAYSDLGEIAYLDRKWEQFRQSVAADPLDFADRVTGRFLAATLWYVPFQEPGRPWTLVIRRITQPLPFLGLLFLLISAICKPLDQAQWIVITVYLLYLLPYIVISYYERYALPLIGMKVLFVTWAADRLLAFARIIFQRQPMARAA